MTRLSVNINKVALIRNARGESRPDLRQFAIDCERFGAQGITVHPRPDQRHIRYSDLPILKEVVTTEFNIEGYPSDKFIAEVLKVVPHQVTLVPDPPGVLTSSEGWDTISHLEMLKEVISRFQDAGIRVSLFLEADTEAVQASTETGTDRIEFYTGHYAQMYTRNPAEAVSPHKEAAIMAQKCDLGINAGHDLDLDNLAYYANNVPGLAEVSIGHALISDALYFGIQNTIGMYLHQLNKKS
ncbi:MAG: pyridoxine 5'-phosphate synthase [Saprospiraceae bacterium]|nr:pyridoxine 5'-phosphate synthase [Saprospiraceae bacterium]